MAAKKAGTKAPAAVTRQLVRTGLKVSELVTVHDPDTPEGRAALVEVLMASDEQSRFARVQDRARCYADVADVATELEWIAKNVGKPGRALACAFALLAIERGLDLLDTGAYLGALERDRKTQASRRRGAQHRNRTHAKLPEPPALEREMRELADQGRTSREVRSVIRQRYGCTSSALSQRLKKYQEGS